MQHERKVVVWLVGSFLIGAIAALLLFTWSEGHKLSHYGDINENKPGPSRNYP